MPGDLQLVIMKFNDTMYLRMIPLQCFSFTDTSQMKFGMLVTETNQYSWDNLSHKQSARTLCSVDEMKVFIGITILMRIVWFS